MKFVTLRKWPTGVTLIIARCVQTFKIKGLFDFIIKFRHVIGISIIYIPLKYYIVVYSGNTCTNLRVWRGTMHLITNYPCQALCLPTSNMIYAILCSCVWQLFMTKHIMDTLMETENFDIQGRFLSLRNYI